MPKADKRTTPRQFRLDENVMSSLDYLQLRYGLNSRAEVIRHMAAKCEREERSKEAKEVKEQGEQ